MHFWGFGVSGLCRGTGRSQPMKQNASPGQQSEAPKRRWKPGREQHSGPESQDSQHKPNQPRGFFPDFGVTLKSLWGKSRVGGRFGLFFLNLDFFGGGRKEGGVRADVWGGQFFEWTVHSSQKDHIHKFLF